MKRIIMIPVIIALLFFSCKKTEESRAEEDTASVEDEVVENEAIDTGFKPGNYGYALQTQAIIGEVELIDIVKDSKEVFAIPGNAHWVLSKPVLYDKPVLNVLGKLKLWEY